MGANEQSDPASSARVICVVGPTASGKTELAQKLAIALDGEVVSADSMQIYKGMDIGTGKIKPSEQKVPHHGLDLCDPGVPYSAALYQAYARPCFADIAKRGKRSVLCGGTGLYVRAAIDEYEFPQGEQVGNATRDRYMLFAEKHGAQALWDTLNTQDSESAAVIHPNNVRRVVRAFEMLDEGMSYADRLLQLQELPQAIPALFLGLKVSPEVLAKRIERRVDSMFDEGLVGEVEGLLHRGFREGVTAPRAIGYKEIVAALEGETSLEEAAIRIKTATRRYGKRQRTWFRKDQRIVWLHADSGDTAAVLDQALAAIAAMEDGNQQGIAST